jgi:MoxR-like ATPase
MIATDTPGPTSRQIEPAEVRYRDELALLAAADDGPRPPGWVLTPVAVVTFIAGSGGRSVSAAGQPARVIEAKFVGERALVERCVVTLAGERALLLVGEPGTAKSMLSELLAAAISGGSDLTVQGTAGTTEDQLRYGWNYASLLAHGPTRAALVPSPVLTAMASGRVVRIEEVTRCLPEIQDALVSLLSDRRLSIPELDGDGATIYAAPGFTLIATANLRDRGVSEMSAALKRRFNFEQVPPIGDLHAEIALVERQARAAVVRTGAAYAVDDAVLEALVIAFRDLRTGQSVEGWAVERPSTVMSTAEAVAVATSLSLSAAYFPEHRDALSSLPGHLLGVVHKDEPADRARLLAYWDGPVRRRAEDGGRMWRQLWEHRDVLGR